METIVPPVTTPGLTPGTDNGGVGGSLVVSGQRPGGAETGNLRQCVGSGRLGRTGCIAETEYKQPIVPNSGQAESDSQYSNLTAAGKSSVSRRN